MHFFTIIRVKAVAVDTFSSKKDFMETAAKITQQKQVISRIKKSQLINVNGRNPPVGEFFENYASKAEKVVL